MATTYAPDPYSFARPNTNPRPTTAGTPFNFPPPKPKDKRSPFAPPNQKPASTGADKFNAWTRPPPPPPNTWDRTRFETEAARGFSNMRQSQTAPQMPPRSTRQHPTAPKHPPPTEPAHNPNMPASNFPGLSRTQSARKPTGYMPGAHGNSDEPAAPRTSAYAHVRAERPYAPPQPPNIHVSDPYNMRSPPVSRARPTVSPLRHTRSSDYDMRSEPLGTSRPSAKYATPGGERIDIHDDGLHRSASVRNSPVEPGWEDRGPFGQSSSRYGQVPRHRSASPKVSSSGIHADYSSSSGEDEVEQMSSRPKATPKSRPKPQSGPSFQAFADDDPALTGHFPSTNYTKVVKESQHQYPPPEPREHTRKPWTDTASPDGELPRDEGDGRGGNMDGPKYASASPDQSPQSWSQYFGINRSTRGQSFNGIPSWAVPSSVYPQKTPPRTEPRKVARRAVSDAMHRSVLPEPAGHSPLSRKFTNLSASHHEKPAHSVNGTFVASDWHDKVTSDDFRPNDSHLRKSPSKTSRTIKPVPRGRGLSRAADREGQSSSESSAGPQVHRPDTPPRDDSHSNKAAAFQPGKLSGDWASNFKTSNGRAEGRAASHQRKDDSDSASSREPYVVVEEDVMDIDDQPVAGNGHRRSSTNGINVHVKGSSRRSSNRQSMNGGIDLSDFTKHAPFVTNPGGLKDMDDLASNLPFESRAEKKVELDRKATNNKVSRPLDLPRPPRAVMPPAEDRLTMDNFTQYTQNMAAYMKEWNIFNASMLEHFRHRQDMVCGNMLDNWIKIRSDGPDAHGEDGDAGGGLNRPRPTSYAGYATYMQWLQDDAKCREWWDHANELHMKCLEDLGRIREKAKTSFSR